MKLESDTEIKYGCCYPESKIKHSCMSRALTINPSSSTSNTTLSRLLLLGNEERKAVDAYKLQVEQRRSMAIEYARRNTIR
jgi:hypothetical protein